MMNQTTHSLGPEGSDPARGSLQPHALHTTREFAAKAIERAAEKARDAREGLKDASTGTGRQLGQWAKLTSRYVSERPVASALVAASVGAAVTALALAMLRNKRRQS